MVVFQLRFSRTLSNFSFSYSTPAFFKNLDYLKKSLSKLDLDSVTKLTVLKIKLLWPFKATETKELVERIARNKRDLADALTYILIYISELMNKPDNNPVYIRCTDLRPDIPY